MNEHRDENDTCNAKNKDEIDPCPDGTATCTYSPNWIMCSQTKSAALIFFISMAKMILLSQGHCYLPLKKRCLYCLASYTLILGNI